MSGKVLVVAPSWIGDMVMAQPLLGLLHEQGYQIDVLALPWIRQVLSRMVNIHDVIDMPLGHGKLEIGRRRQIGKPLRARQYDRSVVLPNTLKSALIPFFADIPRRSGFHGEMRFGLLNDRRKLNSQAMPLLLQRYYSLGLNHGDELPHAIPYPVLSVSATQVQDALQALQIDKPKDDVVVLCPGAEYGAAKRWPERHYAELAKNLIDRGKSVWLMGSEKDQPVCDEINSLADGQCLNLAGVTGLSQAIDLMSLAGLVVTNDSGLMHVACALGIKTIALFGSTSPGYTPPLSDDAEIISLGLECSPCFERDCPFGHLDCLNKLSPQLVLDRIQD